MIQRFRTYAPSTRARALNIHYDVYFHVVFVGRIPVLFLIDLHGRVGDGLDLRARGVFGEVELFSISRGFDGKCLVFRLHLSDVHSASDEERLSGEDEEELVEKVEEKRLQVLTSSFDAVPEERRGEIDADV